MTHTPAEWAQMVSLAVALYASASVPFFVLVDADLADFDPRPAVRHTHQLAVHVGHDLAWITASAQHELAPVAVPVRHAAYGAREVARDTAALLVLLTTSPKGTLR